MKRLFLAMPIVALVFLLSCGSSPPAQPRFNASAGSPDRTVTVNFTVSDSVAFSFAQVWISQNFVWRDVFVSMFVENDSREERDPITVSDPASGVLAGEHRNLFFTTVRNTRGDDWFAQFRIFINDGTATLLLSGLHRSGRGLTGVSSQQEAQDAMQRQIDNWAESLENSFKATFF